jgi:hypothetical protein
MPERLKSLFVQFGIPILMLVSALSVAQYKLDRKEDASDHAADVQRLQSQQEATYQLLLDVRCQQEPNDRRCK